MSSKKKRKKPQNIEPVVAPPSYDTFHEYSLGSERINKDHLRRVDLRNESLPFDDPKSVHFNETIQPKDEYVDQTLEWAEYDTSNDLNLQYLQYSEFDKYHMEYAPFEDIEQKDFNYHAKAYKDYTPHIEVDNYPNLTTGTEANDSEYDPDMKHPSDGGDTKEFIFNELKQHQRQYKEWKKLSGVGWEETLYNSALAEPYEHKENWWNLSSKERYDMPHQALHGGVDKFDDENDMPLNSYWHKSTVSPDSWHVMKTKFRDNMRPGSAMWNKWAFRSELERTMLKHWPAAPREWFLKSEHELTVSHEFRAKMMDHSAMDEYWRMGELRWNRKLWEPYIRIGTWVCAPLIALLGSFLWSNSIGSRPMSQFDVEYEKWRAMVKDPGTADEYYIFSWRDSLLKRKGPPIIAETLTVEQQKKYKEKTIETQTDKMIRGIGSINPY